MITLNLIPDNQKKLLKGGRRFATFREIVMLIFIFASIMAMMLWLSRYFLEEKLFDLAEKNSASILSNEYTNSRIAKLNGQIKSAKLIANNYSPIRSTLSALMNLVPENIAINSLAFNRNQSSLTLSGIAKSRSDLLSFKQQLSTVPWITAIDLPMSDLIDKNNNSFNITLSLNTAILPYYEN